MRVVEQTTIAVPVTLSGTGLHSGALSKVVLRPAPPDSGVVFYRSGAGERRNRVASAVSAHPHAVAGAHLGTRLENAAGVSVMTVEHLLAAFVLCGLDNVVVDVTGPEAPILDGSAAPIVAAVREAGLKRLPAARSAIRIDMTHERRDGDRFIRAEPFDGRIVDVTIEFPDAAIGRQQVVIDLDNQADIRRLASARTFCRLEDIEFLRASGLCQGGSLDNALVVDGARILNDGGLRDPEEFALHKALDLVGDLHLLGAPLIGRIVARKCGHDLNTGFARSLLADTAAWTRTVIEAPPAVAHA